VSALQLTSYLGIPLTALLIGVALMAFARPDRSDDGPYAAFLGLTSLLALYTVLLAATATLETVGQHLVLGDPTRAGDGFNSSPISNFAISAFNADGDLAPAFAWGAVAIVMIVLLVFFTRRRDELLIGDDAVVERVDKAYGGAVCFAMVSIAILAATAVGFSAYELIAQPVGISDQARDLSGVEAICYGALFAAACVIFRAHFWSIRGNDELSGGPRLAEMDEA
jgi:hypothetical protein